MKIDILYCTWNRLQFTTATWAWMMAHTNWDYVDRLIVYDDGSEDGTLEFLRAQPDQIRQHGRSVPIEIRSSDLRSPAAIMNHYVATSQAEVFAKIDNDIALPGGWLEKMIGVLTRHPNVELLGMEAGMVAMQGRDGVVYEEYGVEPCTNIGGVGLMRVSAFRSRPPIPTRIGSRMGFTEWQDRYELKRGWIIPDLDVPQLDRLPFEPWVSLTKEYVDAGWNREWGKYDPEWMEPYWRWMLA